MATVLIMIALGSVLEGSQGVIAQDIRGCFGIVLTAMAWLWRPFGSLITLLFRHGANFGKQNHDSANEITAAASDWLADLLSASSITMIVLLLATSSGIATTATTDLAAWLCVARGADARLKKQDQ